MKQLNAYFFGLLFLNWAFHIWMAHEKGDWDNLWRWSQMCLEAVCVFIGRLYVAEMIKNEELKQRLNEK